MELLLSDDTEVYTLMVSPEVHYQALRDYSFAGQLLEKHKRKLLLNKASPAACASTECNDLLQNTSKLIDLKLQNQHNDWYSLFVDKDTYTSAKKDLSFATKLLENYKSVIENRNAKTQSAPDFGNQDNR